MPSAQATRATRCGLMPSSVAVSCDSATARMADPSGVFLNR